MFATELDPGTGAVVVAVSGSITVYSQGHGAVEELVSVTDLGSLWFVTWSSVIADCL